MPLVPIIEAGPLLGAKDRRSVRRRLAALRVPLVDVGGRVMVDLDDVEAAVGRAKMTAERKRPTMDGTLPPITGKLF